MSIVGLSQRGRRILGTMLGVVALAALIVPSVEAAGPGFKPAILDVTGWKLAGPSTGLGGVALAGVPLPNSGDGIGPGSYLLIDKADGSFICTANFVWSGSDGNTYLGAAGHCFLPAGVDHEDTPGATVQVCVSDCFLGGQIGTLAGTYEDLGEVAFARQSADGIDIGNDFGIVKIPQALLGKVRHSVPVWVGPTTSTPQSPTLGSLVCLYGNAAGLGEVFATKARFGIGGVGSADSWSATIPSAPGDSGSAVVNCPGLTGSSPAGLLTHLAIGGTGIIAGTTVVRAQEMAREAGVTLTLLHA